jgi:hypothetical protein
MNDADSPQPPTAQNFRSLRELSQGNNSEDPLTQPSPEPVYQEGSPLSYLQAGIHHEDILLGEGFLERGAALLLIAQSGVGKSVVAMQAGSCWAISQTAFDLQPYQNKNLRIVMIQNEDSRNDLYRQSLMLDALSFSTEKRNLLDENFRIFTVRGKLGLQAIGAIRSILDKRSATDLLVLNPMSAYAQGDLANTEDCVEFLYGQLSPLLDDYNCAGWLLHHTPKMTGSRRTNQKQWNTFDYMYSGAGAATITNYARGIITIDSVGDSTTFSWRVAKRLHESGWPTPTQFFKWHVLPQGGRVWVAASSAETTQAESKAKKTLEDLYNLVPASCEPVLKDCLLSKALDEEGFTHRLLKALLAEALADSAPEQFRLYRWQIYNPEGGQHAAVARIPQPEDQKPAAVKARLKREKAEREDKIIKNSE